MVRGKTKLRNPGRSIKARVAGAVSKVTRLWTA